MANQLTSLQKDQLKDKLKQETVIASFQEIVGVSASADLFINCLPGLIFWFLAAKKKFFLT